MAQDFRVAGSGAASPSVPSPSPATPIQSSKAPASASSSSAFKFPHYYNYPPMFTLQPNLDTRRAQLDKWSSLVLAYCRHYRIFRLVVAPPTRSDAAGGSSSSSSSSGPVRVDGDEAAAAAADADGEAPSVAYYAPDLFRNRTIDRTMPAREVREVFEDLRRQGRIEVIGTSSSSASHSLSTTTSPADPFSCYVFWKTPEEWAAAIEAFVDDTAQRGSVLTLYELTAGDGTRGSDLHGLDPVVLQRALATLVKRGKAQVFGQEDSLGVKFF
ncbi:ESCRT-II complex subunit VPS25 [Sporothrix schenckii 1099-18]|uniref:ESCRT-II complex subunit VPS25 n=2 Tax=Sporothrix schenckii TaxID=29908 RepID=U7PZP5_SPOS1|nr:ESCRT-II complex subunit VPS25 [Sporothrix schenckii 1099-18]ERT01124.1 hypothetical protein HMPREF1624_02363 [Sporothrix schenckii ATCC 58251]KJR88258.1 ESCRT-II complex subunit VPS25 [Sporothrix schenckii 1099-18]